MINIEALINFNIKKENNLMSNTKLITVNKMRCPTFKFECEIFSEITTFMIPSQHKKAPRKVQLQRIQIKYTLKFKKKQNKTILIQPSSEFHIKAVKHYQTDQ